MHSWRLVDTSTENSVTRRYCLSSFQFVETPNLKMLISKEFPSAGFSEIPVIDLSLIGMMIKNLLSELSAACVIVSGEVIISQPSFIFGGESSAYGELTSLQWCAAASTAVISGLQPVFLRLIFRLSR